MSDEEDKVTSIFSKPKKKSTPPKEKEDLDLHAQLEKNLANEKRVREERDAHNKKLARQVKRGKKK